MKKYIISLVLIGLLLIGIVFSIIYFSESPILESNVKQGANLDYGKVIDDVTLDRSKEGYEFLFEELGKVDDNSLSCVLITVDATKKQYKALVDDKGNIKIFDYNSYLKDMYGSIFTEKFNDILLEGKSDNVNKNITSDALSYNISVDFKLIEDLRVAHDISFNTFDNIKGKTPTEVYTLWEQEKYSPLNFYPIINIGINGQRGEFDSWDIDVDLTHLVFSLGSMDNRNQRPFGIKVYFEDGAEDDCCVIDYSTGKIDTFYTTDVLKPWLNIPGGN